MTFPLSLCLLSLALTSSNAKVAPPITAAAFTPDGNAVVVGSQAGLEVLSWPELKPLRKLPTELSHIHDLAFSPRGDLLAAAGGRPAREGTLELFHWPKGDLVRSAALHEDVIAASAWRSDGRELATASADRTCRVQEAESGKLVQVFKGHSRPVLALCYLPDGKTLVSTGIDQTLRVWDVKTGDTLRSLDNHVGSVHALALRPGTSGAAPPVVASVSADRTVRLWQPTIGRMVRFTKLSSEPLAVAWTPDGKSLLAGCSDGRLRILDPDTGEVVHEQAGLTGWLYTLAVPASGRDLFAGGEGGKMQKISMPSRK